MATKTCIAVFFVVAVAVQCSDARARLGKLTRQSRQIQPLSSPVSEAIVTNVIGHQKTRPLEAESLTAPLVNKETKQFRQQTYQPLSPQLSQQPFQPVQQIQPQNYQPIQQQQQQVAQSQFQPVQQIQPQNYQPIQQQQQHVAQSQVQPTQQYQGVQQQQYQPIQQQQQYQQKLPSYQTTNPAAFDTSSLIKHVENSAPAYSQLVYVKPGLASKLPSNATRIRPNLVDGFSCKGRKYGYYADTLNDCQVFHVCYPLKDVFKNHPEVLDITYDFSFICNDFLAFDQSSLTCGWATEVVPCEHAEQLYDIANSKFFEVPKITNTQGNVVSPNVPAPIPYPPVFGFQGAQIGSQAPAAGK